ncbi:MAG: hypothetical protein ACTJG1_07635, partial [Enterococcus gilvus]
MRKPIQYKRMVPLLLPVVVIIGVFFFYYHGKALKASAPDSLVSVTVDKKAVPNDSLTTEEEEVELALKAKETALLELPYDDTVSVVPLDEEGQEVAYPQIDSSDFKKDKALKFFDDRLKAEQSSEDEKTKEEEANEIMKETEERLPYYQVHKPEGKGSFYFELEKDQVQRVRIKRLMKKEKTVNIQLLKDTTKKQGIVVFKATDNLEAVNPIPEIPMAPEQATEEKTEEAEVPTANEETPSEASSAEQAAPEKKGIDPKGISMDKPFKVSVDLGKEDGTGEFDDINDPGYDKNKNNSIVRTFDQVTYQPTMGISNIDNEKYVAISVRIDMELPNAWRKDSSGQVRQTAEFAYGTLVDTGNGTKKSVRSVVVNADQSSGQAFTTETLNVYGAVHGDELKPKVTFTIVSATLSNKYGGGTEVINQIVDSSIKPELETAAKVTVSAKPLVDVKMAWTDKRLSTFEKTTSTTDKPYTMVTNIGSYVQLKPLPNKGRDEPGSIKGSTYPVGGIKYKINQKMVYTNDDTNVDKDLVIGTDTRPMEVIAYDGLTGWTMPNKKMTSEYLAYQTSFQPISRQGLNVPVGYTRKIYSPTETPPNKIDVGIYDTGNPIVENGSSNVFDVKNTDYKPISVGKNKWTLSEKPLGSNDQPFSVVAMQVAYPYEYLEKFPGVNGSMHYILSVSEVEYEGSKQKVDSQIDMNWDRKWPGAISAYSSFTDKDKIGLNSASNRDWASYGNGQTTQGNSIWASSLGSFTDIEGSTGVLFTRWNANSFSYDKNRAIRNDTGNNGVTIKKNYYGVGIANPSLAPSSFNSLNTGYSWYSSPEEAISNGDIVAIKTEYETYDSAGSGRPRIHVPLKVSNHTGAKDEGGKPNVLLSNVFNFSSQGKQTSYYPVQGNYRATTYTSDGKYQTPHSPNTSWGDTLYIAGMTIRPNIYTDKSTYTPDEKVNWTVDAKVESGSENNHKVEFEVKIPKATLYTPGTAKDHLGKPLPDPSSIVQNGDGEWVMKWVLDYIAKNSTYNPKISFDTSIISSKLDFVFNVANLKGTVTSEVWLEDDESVRDTSDEEKFRISTTNCTVTNSGVIVIDKVVDKPFIESGNKIDPAKPEDTHPTDFTYTVSFKNHSSTAMNEVRVLDVLPYNGDERGTSIHNDYNGYSLMDVKQLPGSVNGEIWYTKNPVAADRNPNLIILNSGWYQLGSDMSVLKDARAIMAIYEKLEPGKEVSLSLKMRPNEQKAGDKYV